MSAIEIILDKSYNKLTSIPKTILDMSNLKMLYLEGNLIETLPDNFFQCLSKLSWLDLRSNKMISIPTGIANHPTLENLLLQNNHLYYLPNELGLVPNLKVLQLSGNPIIYPPAHIIENGVDDICIYLRQEYDRIHRMDHSLLHEPDALQSDNSETETETTITCDPFEPIDNKLKRFKSSSKTSQTRLEAMMPSIMVKGLSKPIDYPPNGDDSDNNHRKVHKIMKSPSKLSVHSHYNTGKYVENMEKKTLQARIEEQHLKEVWLEQLKDLLHDQEKIIQQEKSLQALSMWRVEKKAEAPRTRVLQEIPEAPYDTDPEYRQMLSRKDLNKEIDKLIATKTQSPNNIKIQQLINDVVSQLKDLDLQLATDASPDLKLKNAEREINVIMDLHKRIAEIQHTNETY